MAKKKTIEIPARGKRIVKKKTQRKALPSKLMFALIQAPRIVEQRMCQMESTLNLTRGKYAY